jgi:hypothetical protein
LGGDPNRFLTASAQHVTQRKGDVCDADYDFGAFESQVLSVSYIYDF